MLRFMEFPKVNIPPYSDYMASLPLIYLTQSACSNMGLSMLVSGLIYSLASFSEMHIPAFLVTVFLAVFISPRHMIIWLLQPKLSIIISIHWVRIFFCLFWRFPALPAWCTLPTLSPFFFFSNLVSCLQALYAHPSTSLNAPLGWVLFPFLIAFLNLLE